MGYKILTYVAFTLLLYGLLCVTAKKVILMPPPWHSHIMELLPIGEHLITDHEHEVHVLLHKTKKLPSRYAELGIKPIYFGEDKTLILDKKSYQMNEMLGALESKGHSIEEVIKANMAYFHECADIHLEEEVFQMLDKMKFDFAIVDGSYYSRYFLILTHRLKIPHGCTISILPLDLPLHLMTLPSYHVPDDEGKFIPPLNFRQRLENVKSYYAQRYQTPDLFLHSEWQKKYSTKENPFSSVRELAAKTKFWIYDRSPMLITAIPRAPHVFQSYGLTRIPIQPLPADVKKFADEAKDGLVVISFGGIAKYTPARYINDIARAIAKLPKIKFIWRLNVELDVPLPSNLKAMTWMPQNDILAHPNTKLFITHCGNNGITEALTHGVPMLGFPLHIDQPHNCNNMKKRGYGDFLQLANYSADILKKTIEEIFRNPSYSQRAKKASSIINSQPNPGKFAAVFAHQVIEFGDEHLQNATQDLYWYEFLMWDIALLIFLAILVPILVILFLIKCLCCKSNSMKEKQS